MFVVVWRRKVIIEFNSGLKVNVLNVKQILDYICT